MIVHIYSINDPDTLEVKYIGKTIRPLRERLWSHRSYIKKNPNRTHFTRWFSKLTNSSKSPIITLIEECNINNWEERERYWIKYYREFGSLTNTSPGGINSAYGQKCATFKGKRHSEETKKIISEKHKKIVKSPEWIYNAGRTKCVKLIGINLVTNDVLKFDCISDAAIYLGDIKYRKNIHQNMKNQRRSAYGYKWVYETTESEDKEP